MEHASQCTLCGGADGWLCRLARHHDDGSVREIVLCETCSGLIAMVHDRRQAQKAAGCP